MDNGFYAASAGLKAQAQAIEVAAHNLANLNTTGFRAQEATFQSLLAVSRPTVPNILNLVTNNFGVLEGTHLDLSPGNLEPTGNPLDLGIEGSGFFAVLTPKGVRYTRNGSFRVSKNGTLVTAAGGAVLSSQALPVLTAKAPAPGDAALLAQSVITVPPGAVSIATDGTLSVNGAVAGSIQLVDFAPGTKLTSEGETLIEAPPGSAQAAKTSTLRQGALENSNVSSIGSVVTLIGVQRRAEMLQRALSLFDTEFNRIATSDLAKV